MVNSDGHGLRVSLGETWEGPGWEVHKVHDPKGTAYALLVSSEVAETLTEAQVARYLRGLGLGWKTATYQQGKVNLGLLEDIARAASSLPPAAHEWTAEAVFNAVGDAVGKAGLTVARTLRGWGLASDFLRRLIKAPVEVVARVLRWLCGRAAEQVITPEPVELCLVGARPPPD